MTIKCVPVLIPVALHTRNSFPFVLSCHENFLLDKLYRRTFVCLLRAAYGAHMVSARKHNDLPHHCSRNFNEKHLWMRLPKTCFSPEIMPFSCPENVPQKCKWLQCVRLVINKRRPSAAVAAAPQRHPRASRSGADQAHTLSRTNQPLNRPIPSRKRERATSPRRTTKSAAGSGAVPANPLGIGCRFSPSLALSFYGLIVLQILSSI